MPAILRCPFGALGGVFRLHVAGQRVLPGGHLVQAEGAEFGVVEDGVGRADGGGGVGGGGDGGDRVREAGEFEGGFGELVPGTLSVGDGVVEAGGDLFFEHEEELAGQVVGGGRGDDLVGDDAERFAGLGGFDHGVDEVEAAFEFATGDAEEAAGADDVAVVGGVGEGHGVAAETGEGVNGFGADGGGFGDGLVGGGAFDDVIGADLHEGDVAGLAGAGEFADGDDVGAVGGVGFFFAQVDVVERGGVDDRVGVDFFKHAGEGDGVGDVELGAAGEGGDLVALLWGDAGEIEAQLAGGSEHGDFHCIFLFFRNARMA